jgi:integrase
MDFYEQRLALFSASALADKWQRVQRADLRAWLDQMECGAVTRAMTFRALRAFYRWAARAEPAMCGKPPTEGITIEGALGDRSAPEFYAVEAVAVLLEGCAADIRPAVAAQLFAGLRPEEVAPKMGGKERISWEDFNFEEKIVRVPAAVAKTRAVRLIEALPATLWAWLEATPKARREGPLWPGTYDWLRARTKAALGKQPWVRDGLRHTFATHAVAWTRDVGQVSEWLGHEGGTRLLHRNYKSAVLRAAAEKYFALRPATGRVKTKRKGADPLKPPMEAN